jgi:hypothetical protein
MDLRVEKLTEEHVESLSHEETTELLVRAWTAHENLLQMIDNAWGIISSANWSGSTSNWAVAAIGWRERYYELLREENLPEEENKNV